MVPGLPLLDELIANAWPPAHLERVGGWRLRWTNGVTRRANSALTTGGVDLDALVVAAEAFYGARGATARFQVSSASAPVALGDVLRRRGYQDADRTLVMHAVAADVLAQTDPGAWPVTLSDRVLDDWFAAYWAVESTRGRSVDDARICRHVLLAPPLPTVYVGVPDGSNISATGQIVIERGWAGVQCMATVTSHRRRGAASAVLHHPAPAAQAGGADRLYLAVLAATRGRLRSIAAPASSPRTSTATSPPLERHRRRRALARELLEVEDRAGLGEREHEVGGQDRGHGRLHGRGPRMAVGDQDVQIGGGYRST